MEELSLNNLNGFLNHLVFFFMFQSIYFLAMLKGIFSLIMSKGIFFFYPLPDQAVVLRLKGISKDNKVKIISKNIFQSLQTFPVYKFYVESFYYDHYYSRIIMLKGTKLGKP